MAGRKRKRVFSLDDVEAKVLEESVVSQEIASFREKLQSHSLEVLGQAISSPGTATLVPFVLEAKYGSKFCTLPKEH